jgi:alpha-beta hydrolase superfamily lysophospholipase
MQEHFLPYFAAAGYDSYAVSLRAQGKSDRLPGMKACTLMQHAADLGSIVQALPRSPVLIGHSFGGLVVQRSGHCNFLITFHAVTFRSGGSISITCVALGTQ